MEEALDKKSKAYKAWEEVKAVVKHWKYIKEKDRDTNIQVDIGCGVSVFAEVTEFDKMNIDIGLGIMLEMDYDEAEKYADIRLNLIRKEINHLRNLAVDIKVHIKLVLLAVYELQLSVKPKRVRQHL